MVSTPYDTMFKCKDVDPPMTASIIENKTT
jgi:hypothetical protein